MTQIQHIRLSGHTEAFALTQEAHTRLLSYLSDSRAALGFDPDADETVRDLEAALGDRLRELIGVTGAPVQDAGMTALLAEVGVVAGKVSPETVASGPARGPFWCTINQGKWFGGLCLGIATRKNFRVDWVRTVALLLALLTAGVLGVVYLVALLFVPRVESIEEYRRMCAAAQP